MLGAQDGKGASSQGRGTGSSMGIQGQQAHSSTQAETCKILKVQIRTYYIPTMALVTVQGSSACHSSPQDDKDDAGSNLQTPLSDSAELCACGTHSLRSHLP